MKRLGVILVALTGVAAINAAARAQDAGQIESVRSGATACRECNLFQADLAYQVIARRDLSGARLRQSNMTAGVFDGTLFTSANLSLAEGSAGRFTRADFASANLEGANFVGAYVGYANFDGASLAGANFSGANMEGARGLTQGQLSAACGDAATRLPEGLAIPDC